uniref:Ycf13 n=1 Tax=Lepocinclis steinii TaxID=459226 RepID=A0A3G3LLL4_9EUGL|nr:ycf13 [Lepocinclis steinii]AYQ93599.1 ycf13 [Lepocinclis steinii]
MFNNNSSFISWEKACLNVFRLQRRIYKSVCVGDFSYTLRLQKLLLVSSSARLLAIRMVADKVVDKNLDYSDNKVSLNFLEKFQINNTLLQNANNWSPGKYKEVIISQTSLGKFSSLQIWSIPDRCWQFLVRLIIDPAYIAISFPGNFSLYFSQLVHKMQKSIFLKLNKQSYGLQKRILIIHFLNKVENFSCSFLLKKILAPRSIKLGIFRFLKLGLKLDLNYKSDKINPLGFLLVNVLFNDVDYISNGIRVGENLLVFLKPSENEFNLLNKIVEFFYLAGINKELSTVDLFSVQNGFDFLDWHYKLYPTGEIYCVPSSISYNIFLRRVKNIINNSNYGAKAKVAKLFPIIQEWNSYNKFCDLKSSYFSLFFLKKRAFKSFKKESKQDLYSSKILLNRAFNSKLFNRSGMDFSLPSCNYSHLIFCSNFLNNQVKLNFSICIHCGMSATLSS